jgi:hypothetical protein
MKEVRLKGKEKVVCTAERPMVKDQISVRQPVGKDHRLLPRRDLGPATFSSRVGAADERGVKGRRAFRCVWFGKVNLRISS